MGTTFFYRDCSASVALWAVFFVLPLLVGAGFWIYELDLLDSLKFFAGVFVLFYIPGSLLIRWTGLNTVNGLSLPVLSLGTGVVLVPAIYRILRHVHSPELYAELLLASCAAAWLFRLIRSTRTNTNSLTFRWLDLSAVAALLIFVLVLLHFSHFTDVLMASDGFEFRSSPLSESVFHLGIINALADTYPPPALYASGGSDFSYYHLNMHVQADLLVRWLGIGSLQLVSFYLPLLYFSLLVLLPFIFVLEAGGTALTGWVCGALVFGENFSFIPGIVLQPAAGFPWSAYFQSTTWGLFTLNGIIPGCIALFLCIFCLRDYFKTASLARLALFALLSYGAFGFKSSMGIQIGVAALATGLLIAVYGRLMKQGWSLVIFAAGALVVMVLDLAYLRTGTGHSIVAFMPLRDFSDILRNLGAKDLSGTGYVLFTLLALLAGLGIRSLGLYYLYDRCSQAATKDWNLVFLALFFICGLGVSSLFFIGDPAGQNNAKWFYIQSLMAAWFLFYLFLIRMQKNRTAYLAAILAALALATPSTLQFLAVRAQGAYVHFGRDELGVIDYLHKTEPDSVVLHPLNLDRPSLASNFAGRPTVLSVWLSFVTETDGLSQRVKDSSLFFTQTTAQSDRQKILDAYQVDYVYGPASDLLFMQDLSGAELAQASGELVLYHVTASHVGPR